MKRIQPSIFFLVSLALIAYFAYHAANGRHGLEARGAMEKRLKALEAELQIVKAERERLERQAAGMTAGEGRDEDLIEEQARTLLNFARPDDVILMQRKSESP